MAMSTPRADTLFIMDMTLVSFPGMILAEYSSKSVEDSFKIGEASLEARHSAALGSACKPGSELV